VGIRGFISVGLGFLRPTAPVKHLVSTDTDGLSDPSLSQNVHNYECLEIPYCTKANASAVLLTLELLSLSVQTNSVKSEFLKDMSLVCSNHFLQILQNH